MTCVDVPWEFLVYTLVGLICVTWSECSKQFMNVLLTDWWLTGCLHQCPFVSIHIYFTKGEMGDIYIYIYIERERERESIGGFGF